MASSWAIAASLNWGSPGAAIKDWQIRRAVGQLKSEVQEHLQRACCVVRKLLLARLQPAAEVLVQLQCV